MFKLVHCKTLICACLIFSAVLNVYGADYAREIKTKEQFNSLSSPSFLSASFNMPSLMFVIDRSNDDIYYIDSQKYFIHLDFINSQYLSLTKGKTFIENQLDNGRRRFIMGFVVKKGDKDYILEFWEDDVMSPDIFEKTFKKVEKTFFSKIIFNPLSQEQMLIMVDDLSDIPVVKNPVYQSVEKYQMINRGKSFGKLIISGEIKEGLTTEFGNIAVIKYSPQSLAGATGFVSGEIKSNLSHACILAQTVNIPAFYMPGAGKKLAAFKDKYVEFEVKRDTFSIKLVSYKDVQKYLKLRISQKKYSPQADLEFKEITDLKKQKGHDNLRFGAKSANLGQVANFGIKGFKIPDGFTVPFYYYGQFVRENGIADYISKILNSGLLYTDLKFRKEQLKLISEKIQNGKINDELRRKIKEILNDRLKDRRLFVRSSTNAEDLPGFTGAGLYAAVPNVKGLNNVIEAIKMVWASIYNDKAFKAREIFGINHASVMPAVLIQEEINADMAGLMLTRSNLSEDGARPVKIIIKSNKFGGNEKVPTKKLTKISLEIEKCFGFIEQKIEWLIMGETIYILQVSPYKFNIEQ